MCHFSIDELSCRRLETPECRPFAVLLLHQLRKVSPMDSRSSICTALCVYADRLDTALDRARFAA